MRETLMMRIFSEKYGRKPIWWKRIPRGSAECFEVWTGQGKVFVKFYQEKYGQEQVSREITVCRHLRKKGLPVSEYLDNASGQTVSRAGSLLFTVQSYIEGVTYPKFRVPESVLFHSAEILAEIHMGLEDFSGLAEDFTPEWIARTVRTDETAEKLENLIRSAQRLPEHEQKRLILEDCKWKLEALPQLEKLSENFGGLTRRNSHGDYNTLQWICEAGAVKAVVDFTGSCRLPVIWELIRSYTYAGRECEGADAVDAEAYCAYLNRYTGRLPLAPDDLRQGFTFYYYTLVPSLFGYRQYIEDFQRGRCNPAIEFARWRCRFCRWLCGNAERLDEEIYRKRRAI